MHVATTALTISNSSEFCNSSYLARTFYQLAVCARQPLQLQLLQKRPRFACELLHGPAVQPGYFVCPYDQYLLKHVIAISSL